jgi:hypothetical protein
VDEFNNELLAIEIDLNIFAQFVVGVLDRIMVNMDYSLQLRMENCLC